MGHTGSIRVSQRAEVMGEMCAGTFIVISVGEAGEQT